MECQATLGMRLVAVNLGKPLNQVFTILNQRLTPAPPFLHHHYIKILMESPDTNSISSIYGSGSIAALSFFLTSGSIYTHMLILILIDGQYLHNAVFSIKKGWHG